MRKKIITLLVLCCLLSISVNCFAEGGTNDVFTLRNGITFGMTEKEIKSRETLKLKAGSSYGPGEVAGIGNSTVQYVLKDGKLNSVFMELGEGKNYSNTKSDYKNLEIQLTLKYGEGLSLKSGEKSLYCGSWLETCETLANVARLTGSTFDCDYHEWIVYTNDGFVVIDHVINYVKGVNGSSWNHVLEYTYYPVTANNDI